MRWGAVARRCVAAVAALALLGGCGGSSGSPSLSGAVYAPPGYRHYHGPGLSLIFPAGWRQSPYRTDATHSGTTFVSPGPTPVEAAYPRIETELSAPRASFPPPEDFANFIANLRDETTTPLPSRTMLADAVSVASAKVPGASQASLVTVLGPGPRRERDLVALTPRGVIELSVAWYPANQPLDPNAVIDSLRLGG